MPGRISLLGLTHLPAGVGKNDRLGDCQGLVQVTQGVQLPLLLVHVDVELLNTLQGQLVTLDQDTHLQQTRRSWPLLRSRKLLPLLHIWLCLGPG